MVSVSFHVVSGFLHVSPHVGWCGLPSSMLASGQLDSFCASSPEGVSATQELPHLPDLGMNLVESILLHPSIMSESQPVQIPGKGTQSSHLTGRVSVTL